MKGGRWVSLLFLALCSRRAAPCPFIHVTSSLLPFIEDDYFIGHFPGEEGDDPMYTHNGRPIYVSESQPPRYLFHMQVGDDLGGRWLIGGEPGVNSAWAFVQSWALAPHLVPIVSDRATWRVFHLDEQGEGGWHEDPYAHIECRGTDTSVFLSSALVPSLTGLYVETGLVEGGRSVFMNDQLYLYASGCCTWIVGEVPGDNSGLAFVEAEVDNPANIPQVILDRYWQVAIDGGWVADQRFDILGSDHQRCVDALLRQKGGAFLNETAGTVEGGETSATHLSNLAMIHDNCGRAETTFQILQMLRSARKPTGHTVDLWNGVPIPLVGFGTGAMVKEECGDAISTALKVGYRLLDTATAYDNEDIIGALLASQGPDREEVFLESKLWYSELGFDEALGAADRSLQKLRTSYVDSYLIHWPQCYPEVEWMNCEQTAAAGGTWQQSWRALEKLYAEGKALSIGVSNFHGALLLDLLDLASTTPHLVQNHHDVVHQDGEMVDLCQSYGIFYQSYSSLRTFATNTQAGPEYDEARKQVQVLAAKHHVTPTQLLLRWQVQQGIGVIPRSQRQDHAEQNLDVFGFELSEEDMESLSVDWRARYAPHQHHHYGDTKGGEHDEL